MKRKLMSEDEKFRLDNKKEKKIGNNDVKRCVVIFSFTMSYAKLTNTKEEIFYDPSIKSILFLSIKIEGIIDE
jgi:hypothetical protein